MTKCCLEAEDGPLTARHNYSNLMNLSTPASGGRNELWGLDISLAFSVSTVLFQCTLSRADCLPWTCRQDG